MCMHCVVSFFFFAFFFVYVYMCFFLYALFFLFQMKVSNGGTGGDETVCSLRRGCREKKKEDNVREKR